MLYALVCKVRCNNRCFRGIVLSPVKILWLTNGYLELAIVGTGVRRWIRALLRIKVELVWPALEQPSYGPRLPGAKDRWCRGRSC